MKYLLLCVILFGLNNVQSQNLPTAENLREWERKAMRYASSDSLMCNTYLDSIRTQLLDRTDTAHFWKGRYHIIQGAKVWKNPDIPWLKRHYKLALDAFLKLQNEYYIAQSKNFLGRAYVHSKEYDSGRFYLQEAYEMAQNTDSTSLQRDVLGSLGTLYFYSEDYKEALPYMKEYLSNVLSNAYSLSLAPAYNNLAATYYRLGEYDSSLLYHRKSYQIALTKNNTLDIAFSYLNFGEIYADIGEFDSSVFYLEKSHAIFNDLNYEWGVSTTDIILGKAYLNTDRPEKALQKLSQSIARARANKDMTQLRDALDVSISAYEKTNNYTAAFSALSERVVIMDSLDNIIKRQELDELITKYETEKKEQQIALQSAQLAERKAQLGQNRILIVALSIGVLLLTGFWLLNRNRLKKQQQLKLQKAKVQAKEAEINAAIVSQENERARYARDLHDGFGQMISILNMNLGSLKTEAKPDDRLKVFEESEKVIDEMYDELKGICFDLMPQTLIKSGIKSALEEFGTRINKAGKVVIETHFFGLEERLFELQEISLYRITQEWVNNILKYADAQKITLQITKDDHEITLLIEDDGQGFDKSLLTQGKGNGWKNLNTRTNLIHGHLELESEEGRRGNVLILNIPVQEMVPVTEENNSSIASTN